MYIVDNNDAKIILRTVLPNMNLLTTCDVLSTDTLRKMLASGRFESLQHLF